ncbi:hypothetical protein CHARACLAT_017044 [Characodon lateralis]|uniref:Uncharacterized protein n=1 Tax=Characodon lateralis TaxID=208331 RepID=A0ABU7D0L8_9TELE|nr:hypothetical protein [Characodon lateralis]
MDLKASLVPLRDDIRRLEVERSCLEKRITLMEIEREERMADHKETVEKLQEALRELKLEFEVQKNFRTHLEQLTEGLKTELTFLRGRDEPRNISEEEEIIHLQRVKADQTPTFTVQVKSFHHDLEYHVILGPLRML